MTYKTYICGLERRGSNKWVRYQGGNVWAWGNKQTYQKLNHKQISHIETQMKKEIDIG